jgi:hypothetical protein
MTDVTSPRLFVGIAPCRIADTRSGQGFSGQAGPPALAANVTRNFQITGTVAGVPTQCGIPAGADAVSFQFSVGIPTSSGNFIAWPAGGPQPTTSVLNWDGPIVFLGNGTIVPVSAAGSLSVRLNAAAGQSAHLILDVNGYFSDTLGTPANFLTLENSSNGATARIFNLSTTCSGVCGIFAVTASGHAISGFSESTGDGNVGVLGQTNSSSAGAGVWGLASSSSAWGGLFVNNGSNGVGAKGESAFQGVQGRATSLANNSAGVQGSNGVGTSTINGSFTTAGVRGETVDAGYGVMGLTTGTDAAVAGFYVDSATSNGLSGGYFGLGPGTGVFFFNGLAGTGTKSFIEPHPTDASKVIKFVSLEGNEAGTYFRGRGRFQNGIAMIDVPEDFRMTTSPEGLSIQVTPIGQMATVAVQSIDLDRIIVRGSRNVEFFYTVNGVRRAYPQVETIVENERYLVPHTADARIPVYLSSDERQRLIDNGTYTPEGKVNMETARRLGWDKVWEQRARPIPQPEQP